MDFTQSQHEDFHLMPLIVGFFLLMMVGMFASTSFAAEQGCRVPDGFPEELSLPEGAHPVFLVGSEKEMSWDGEVQVVARVYEYSRVGDESAMVLLSHYLTIFQSQGWEGLVEEEDGHTQGRFTKEGVSAVLEISQVGSASCRFKLQVRVALD